MRPSTRREHSAKREAGLPRTPQAGVLSDYATLMVEILKDNARAPKQPLRQKTAAESAYNFIGHTT
jgi:hypothetical protein